MSENQSDPTVYSLALIGAGFCGTLLLLNVIRRAHKPLKIAVIESAVIPGKGVAYGTLDPSHLLNVCIAKMGAFPDDPAHFHHWLMAREEVWRKLDPAFAHIRIDPQGYLPRMIYGAYLEDLWKEALEIARQKSIKLSIFIQEAENVELLPNKLLAIGLASGRKITASTCILATGVFPNKEYVDALSPAQNYIPSIWDSKATVLNFQPNTSQSKNIAIIGTGLTMLDAVTTLISRGYAGHVVAISHAGKLPEKHLSDPNTTPLPPCIDMQSPPTTALGLLRLLRKEADAVTCRGGNWRSVIDAIRPITVSLWMRLPLIEKKKIKRCLFSQWNRHRHRVPSEYLQKIDTMQKMGKFSLLQGSVQSVEVAGNGNLNVVYRDAAKKLKSLAADFVINCSGPDFNIEKTHSRLFQNLLHSKMIHSHPLGWGIVASPAYEIFGSASGQLFAIGQLLIGERFESIAVPDLRMQCSELADRLLEML